MKWRRTQQKPGKSREFSLFYRENKADIDAGRTPARYGRVAGCISTDSVLEMGAAEGTLGLLVAETGKRYLGVESNPARHIEAARRIALQGSLDSHALLLGDIRHHMSLLSDFDTFVGMRCIYYLRSDIHKVFDRICTSVQEVVLVGNAEREERFLAGERGSLGEFEYFATLDGMTSLLTARGFLVSRTEHGVPRQVDPLVIARSPSYPVRD
jgi:hypothetical protein